MNTNSADTDWLQECINLASRRVDELCHTDFWYQDHSASALTIREEWVVKDDIYLPWPIITLTEVSVDGTVLVDQLNYRYRVGSKKIVYAGARWPEHKIEDWILVKGTFGWEITDTTTPPTNLPTAITRATVLLAAAYSLKKRREVLNVVGEKENILDTMEPKEVRTALGRYRRMFV